MLRNFAFKNKIDSIKVYVPNISRVDAGFITTLKYRKT